MASIYEALFLLQFLVVIGIVLYKVYNLMNKGELYDLKVAFLLFLGFGFAYLVGFVTFLLDPEELVYLVIFRLESWLWTLNVLFLIVELIIYFMGISQKIIKPYSSKSVSKGV